MSKPAKVAKGKEEPKRTWIREIQAQRKRKHTLTPQAPKEEAKKK